MNMDNIVNSLEEKARELAKYNEGDYIKDGLLHCGKCHTAKQVVFVLPWNGEVRTPFCSCKCEKEKWEAEKAID